MNVASLIEVFGKRPTRMKLLKDSIERIDLTKDSRILESGCSFGDGVAYACDQTLAKGYGIDLVSEYVDKAKELHPEIDFTCGSIYDTDYPEDYFDLVFSQAAFSLLKEKPKAISEFHRVLRPGSHVIINDFVIQEPVRGILTQDMDFIPCFNSIGTIAQYVKSFETAGFRTILAEDRYSEIIATTLYLSKQYKCSPMEMAALFASILGQGDDCEEKSQCFFSEAKISYCQLIFQKIG